MRLKELKKWILMMEAQGADIHRLTVRQFAIHLMLMGK